MRSRLYNAWRGLRERCNSPAHKSYAYYGGKGVTVCRRWAIFANFAADMAPHPGKGWEIDRKRNARGYCKSNCHWATRTTQNRNRARCRVRKLTKAKATKVRVLYASGLTQKVVAARCGIVQQMVSNIVTNKNWV